MLLIRMSYITMRIPLCILASISAPVIFGFGSFKGGPNELAFLLYLFHPMFFVILYTSLTFYKRRHWVHSLEFITILRDSFFSAIANLFLLSKNTFYPSLFLSTAYSAANAYSLVSSSATYLSSKFVLLCILIFYVVQDNSFLARL